MSQDKLLFDLEDVKLPYSVEAEQSVLGAMIVDPHCISEVAPITKPDFFYLKQHKQIYIALMEMYDKNVTIDYISVLEKLKSDNIYDEAGGKAYLAQLVQTLPSTANVLTYVAIVKERYYSRALLTAAQEIIKDVNENIGDSETLIDKAEQSIYDIRQGRDISGLVPLKSVIANETYDRILKLSNEETREQYLGIPTGIGPLDKITVGLNKTDLIILGARPGMGKTSFALNIATNVALKGRKVCFFSLEMSRDQLAQRLLSSVSGINSEKLRSGELDTKDWVELGNASELLSKSEFYIDETSAITVPEMKAKIRRLGGVDLVIIDYLGLMHSARRIDNRVQEISDITGSLKIMAKELNVPIIVCAQLSRATEAKGKSHRPGLADLRDSGSIEQDADIVLFLYREHYYDAEKDDGEERSDSTEAECIVAKNRHGRTDTIKLNWDAKLTRYTAVDEMR